NAQRKSLNMILHSTDKNRFMLELDHQPYHLEEAEKYGIDFEFAGHTHYGQVWPISWITDAVYEDAFGPLCKGHTDYYVSS
ncbi:metallophosphoesterase, partial [Pseudomonas frederiksbergensis]|nr:metallophosphoesterase [Pseudomonas frederiksbergensis]